MKLNRRQLRRLILEEMDRSQLQSKLSRLDNASNKEKFERLLVKEFPGLDDIEEEYEDVLTYVGVDRAFKKAFGMPLPKEFFYELANLGSMVGYVSEPGTAGAGPEGRGDLPIDMGQVMEYYNNFIENLLHK